MKKVLLTILLLCLSVTAFAQSGIFWDSEVRGQGALVNQNVFATSLYLFTYGGERCDLKDVKELEEIDCDRNGQRWFFGSDKPVDGDVRGLLYEAVGLNYPVGIQDPVDPFVWHVGETFKVAEYRMVPAGNGWVVEVVHFEDSPLDKEDPLFDTYEFTDVIATPD